MQVSLDSLIIGLKSLREQSRVGLDQLYALRSREWFSPPDRHTVLQRVKSGVLKRLGDNFVFDRKFCYFGQGNRALWERHLRGSITGEANACFIDGSIWCKNGQNEHDIADNARRCSAIFLYPFEGMEKVARISSKFAAVFAINWDDHLGWSRHRWWQNVLRYCDCGLSQNPSSARKYAGMGINWLYFPEAGHYESEPLTDKLRPALVNVGSISHSKGREALAIAKALGSELELYGPDTKNGIIAPELCGNLYRSTAASLALSGCGWASWITHLKCRHFEIPCAGGLMIAQDTPGLEKLYKVDQDILTFQTAKEAAAKFHWVLEHPKEAMDIRKRGHERAREHTWARRFADLLAELENCNGTQDKVENKLVSASIR